MDELSLLQALRPQDAYADERRTAARNRLLAEATASAPAGRQVPRGTRAERRISRPWRAGLAAGLAGAAALAVTGTYLTGGTGVHAAAHGAHASGISAAGVLLLAADASKQSAPPPGARWIVWENKAVSTASTEAICGGVAKSVTAAAYVKVRAFVSCPAGAPASLPELRHAKPVGDGGYPDLGSLPDQPGPLLRAVERWYTAHYKRYADALPGHPAPPLTPAGLHAGAFDTLGMLLEEGGTSRSPAVLLRALALIPGTTVVTGARNAAGQPGIAVTITSADPAQTGFSQDEIIFDPHTYQDIGGALVQPDQYVKGGSVTISTTQVWQAYYDAAGRRL